MRGEHIYHQWSQVSSKITSHHITSSGEEFTGRMRGLEDPVGVAGIGDCLASPFDLKVARSLLEERWAGEAVHVEFGLRRHSYGRNVEGILE